MRSVIANIFFYSGLSWMLFIISRMWYGKHHVRIINYHSTPEKYAQHLEKQLKFYHKHYSNVTQKELMAFLDTRIWPKSKPGLILSFDDGLRNNKECAVPLLEKYGFTAWLCVPAGYIHTRSETRDDKKIVMYGIETTTKESVAMNAKELKDVAQEHEIICHTYTHMRLPDSVNEEPILNKELVESKKELEDLCGKKIEGFCWVGGELENYSRGAHEIIKRNYDFAFQTNNYPVTKATDKYMLDRSNVEAWFSKPLFLLTLSGFYDGLYRNKRRAVHQKLH